MRTRQFGPEDQRGGGGGVLVRSVSLLSQLPGGLYARVRACLSGVCQCAALLSFCVVVCRCSQIFGVRRAECELERGKHGRSSRDRTDGCGRQQGGE